MQQAVAPATQKTYSAARNSYKAFCEEITGTLGDYEITAGRVAEWLTWLADIGQLSGDTIETYLSGISTWFVERTSGAAIEPVNPTSLRWVRRVLTGIQKDRAPVDQRRREENPITPPLTMDTIRTLKNAYNLSDPYELNLFAAAALAVGALTRPNALLGTPTYPNRGVQAQHITFFTRERTALSRTEGACGLTPDHCEVRLPVDKNDQLHRGQTRIVSAPTVVQALWNLWRQRPTEGHLFRSKQGKPLQSQTLITSLKSAYEKVRLPGGEHLTAKCFRRGGASTLAGAGASTEEIAAAGGWSHQAGTYHRYIAADQHRKRALEASRLMEGV